MSTLSITFDPEIFVNLTLIGNEGASIYYVSLLLSYAERRHTENTFMKKTFFFCRIWIKYSSSFPVLFYVFFHITFLGSLLVIKTLLQIKRKEKVNKKNL